MTTLELIDTLEQNWDLLAESNDPQMVPSMRFLHERLKKPKCFVSVVGETSSGKSTLINSFLGKKLLPAKAKPTTGTVTCIEYGASEKEEFFAINRDASFEELSLDKFLRLSESPDKQLLRLKVDLPGQKKAFNGLIVFDTPGYNSIIAEHEEVLKEFLPESDVVIFAVSYRIGFDIDAQQLMSFIYELSEKFDTIPVILAINRVPQGVDLENNRIIEIRSHAEDSLHRKLPFVLIRSSVPDAQGNSVLPDTSALWTAVSDFAFSQKRTDKVIQKIQTFVRSLFEQRLQEIDTKLASIEAGQESIEELDKQKKMLDRKMQESFCIIDRAMAKLERELPRQIEYAAKHIVARVKDEIENSSKWKDIGACNAFVSGHLIPFGTKQAAKEIEQYICDVIEQMDKELEELANTAIPEINRSAQTTARPEVKKLLLNLAERFATR